MSIGVRGDLAARDGVGVRRARCRRGSAPAYYVDKIARSARATSSIQHDESQAEQAVDPGVARMATQMLQGVVKSGTGKRAALADRPVAGKTGTSQDNADAWFVGYTPQLVTAVWMGAPVGRIPMRNVGGINVTGGSYPAKVWHEFMQKALDGQEVLQFGEPPELAERKPAASVPALRRVRIRKAQAKCRSARQRRRRCPTRGVRRRARRPRRRRSIPRSRPRRCPATIRCLPYRRTTS